MCFKFYKHIIENGYVSDEFKLALVRPIYKKDDKNLPVNYRPIFLITTFTKIYENAIKRFE